MKTIKSRILSGAAMAAMLCAGSAAMAQQTDPTQYSTPSEKQQTEQLNQQGANGTYASPARLNGQAPQAYGDATPASNEGGPPPAVQQPYYGGQQDETSAPPDENSPTDENAPAGDAAQAQYQQQMEQYRAQQEDYRAQRAQYEHNMRRYDLATWRFTDYPQAYPYRYGHLRPLYLIAEPSEQLAQLPIEGPGGEWVGKVRNVDIAPDGRPLRIEVALNRRVSVWVRPDHFRYDAEDGVVFTDLTRDELWQEPGATLESSYWP